MYYVDLNVDVLLHPDHCEVHSTDALQRAMPDFDWSGGHSGRILPAQYEQTLEELWHVFLVEHDEQFHPRAKKCSQGSYRDGLEICSLLMPAK